MINHFDVIEVVLKKDLGIKLTVDEEKVFHSIDNEIKQSLFELVNNSAFLDDVEEIMSHIISESTNLTKEEQINIKNKCEDRIKVLKYSN